MCNLTFFIVVELQRWSSKTAQDYLSTGEGKRSIHQWSKRADSEGSTTHGGCQGPWNADLWLQKENRRGWNEIETTTGMFAEHAKLKLTIDFFNLIK